MQRREGKGGLGRGEQFPRQGLGRGEARNFHDTNRSSQKNEGMVSPPKKLLERAASRQRETKMSIFRGSVLRKYLTQEQTERLATCNAISDLRQASPASGVVKSLSIELIICEHIQKTNYFNDARRSIQR
jgi:hypothetical protein